MIKEYREEPKKEGGREWKGRKGRNGGLVGEGKQGERS